MKSLSLLLLPLVLSCASTEFTPSTDAYVTVTRFFDKSSEVEKICGVGKNGCYTYVEGIHFIYAIKSRCVYDHEVDHMFYGSFHKSDSVACDIRPDYYEH